MSSPSVAAHVQEFTTTIRMVQGYRYLDRCGDIMVRLEKALGPGWMPKTPTPQGGAILNHAEGLAVLFNSDLIQTRSAEVPDFELFKTTASKVYEIVAGGLTIERVIGPVLKAIYRIKASTLEDADEQLKALQLVVVSEKLRSAIGGSPKCLHFVATHEEDEEWCDLAVSRRIRLEGKGVGIEQELPWDDRLVSRARLLPKNQQAALQALAKTRSRTLPSRLFSAQIDLEMSFETEFDYVSFSLSQFLDDIYARIQSTMRTIENSQSSGNL